MNPSPVAVVGGGVAGICAATRLAQYGIRTVLFERSARLGGRVSSFFDADFGAELDLGAHIVAKSYRDFLSLLRELGTDSDLHWIEPLHLPLKGIDTPVYHLCFKNLPGMLGPLVGFLSYKALSIPERFRLAAQLARLVSMRDVPNFSAEIWLKRVGANSRQMRYFWQPLILATLNAFPSQVSLTSLQQIIHLGFSTRRGFSLGVPKKPWQRILGDAAQCYLKKQSVDVHLKSRIGEIIIENGRACGITVGGERRDFSAVVLAVSPWDWKSVIASRHFELLFDNIWRTPPKSAVHGVHFAFKNTDTLIDTPMFGLLGTTNHWVFSRSFGDYLQISTVMSASNSLVSESRDRVISMTLKELRAVWPEFNQTPLKIRALRVNRATCPFNADIEKRRPAQKNDVFGLFVASDTTATDLPATLESAARAGFRAAVAVWDYRQI